MDKIKRISYILSIFLALTLILWAILLRFFHLSDQSYWMDEGYTVNAVLSIIEKGKSILDSGQYYGCPTYCYPSALSAHFFGIDNPASYRAFAAIAGIVFIFAIYMIAKKWFENKVALLATFFIAFSYWQIAWSREARWYTLLELFFWLALYFFCELLRSMNKLSPSVILNESEGSSCSISTLSPSVIPAFKSVILNESEGSPCAVSTKSVIPDLIGNPGGLLHLFPQTRPILFFLLTTFFTVLAILTHSEAYLLLPIFTIWTIFTVLSNTKIHIKKKVFITSASILLLTFVALFADSLGLHFLKPLFASLHFHYSLPYYLSFYLRNYWLFIIFAIAGLSISSSVTPAPFSVIPAKAGILSGSSLPTFLLFTLCSYLLAFGLFSDLVHYRYLFLVTPALYILDAYGMVEVSKLIKHKLGRVVFFLVFITIFFISGHGVAVPQTSYQLESDNPSTIKGRPYYAYTPQSNFKGAYAYVKEQKSNEEIVISAHPTFNKIYLREAGYWLSYGYLGIGDRNSYATADSREYYVGAKIIGNLGSLQEITSQNHGYIIYDYYATQGRIAKEELEYISENFKLVYQDESSSFSKIWVYKF